MSIANRYEDQFGRDEGMIRFTLALMAGDSATFKKGYSRENALLATKDAFNASAAEIERVEAMMQHTLVELRIPSDMLHTLGNHDATEAEREISIALSMTDTEDPNSLRWLAALAIDRMERIAPGSSQFYTPQEV